ncbi:hypothetical protein BBL97_17805 [Vibrio parahaemolyticus]|nr:hypothetical protein BBL95_05060 [Vibrio parahaemolyticus]ODX04604.1 hypothetical protein BBL97_17805 [Vibrio parahaemolyticus]ODX04701.1 hypothetical protein BBL98_15455 [Vibrio parahaemolyticus]ODX09747.1 hypothetical protein BBL96_06985 [Vibrio parahaemolyticus]ODX17018.1 hypothetical protein BBL99_15730 [Vibrio parahaemolyticus]
MTNSYISNKIYGVTPISIDNKTDFFNTISACYSNYANTFYINTLLLSAQALNLSGLDPPYLSANF